MAGKFASQKLAKRQGSRRSDQQPKTAVEDFDSNPLSHQVGMEESGRSGRLWRPFAALQGAPVRSYGGAFVATEVKFDHVCSNNAMRSTFLRTVKSASILFERFPLRIPQITSQAMYCPASRGDDFFWTPARRI